MKKSSLLKRKRRINILKSLFRSKKRRKRTMKMMTIVVLLRRSRAKSQLTLGSKGHLKVVHQQRKLNWILRMKITRTKLKIVMKMTTVQMLSRKKC
jgi:hypothetical protein